MADTKVPEPDAEQKMFAEERKDKIMDLIAGDKKVTVTQLSHLFGVTDVTVRNDLRDLEKGGLLTRTHGGAIERTMTGFEQDSRQKGVHNLEAKQKIARAALDLVNDGDTIILDTGTTTLELARLLGRRRNVTVVTNDLVIAQVLEDAEAINVVFMGGLVRKGFHCTLGVQGRLMTAELTIDKAFMAANGFSVTKGATTPDIQQAETKKNMIAVSSKIILLCDRNKIGRVSFVQFAGPHQIDTLVTDQLDQKEEMLVENTGIELMLATEKD
jgi:DeoR family fructose operon transcriptional repressor